MADAFDVRNVHKLFGETKALDGVTLKAEEGTIFGLLGPNGAAKTTLVRMLSTLINTRQRHGQSAGPWTLPKTLIQSGG